MEQYDVAIIGAGVTGAAAAAVLSRYQLRVAVLEKGRLAMLGTPREIFSRGEELEKMGLDVPQTVQLCRRLRAGGMNVPDCLTGEELCAAICAAKGGSGHA